MSDLRCPRCHYDLAWVPGQWTSSCPLRGTCTECGLEFEWALLHSPALAAPEWFVEHPVRQPRFGFVRTLARLVLPWRFWRQVPMDVPLDVKRLFTFVVMILVTMHALKVAERVITHVVWDTFFNSGVPNSWTSVPWWMEREIVLRYAFYPYDVFMYVDPDERSVGAIVDVFVRLGFLVIGGMLVVTPMSFLLLSTSLRRAKVHARHLWRAAAYAVTWVALWGMIGLGVTLVALVNLRMSYWITDAFYRSISVIMVSAAAIWFLFFWAGACRSFDIDHPKSVAFGMLAIGGLTGLVASVAYAGLLNGLFFM
ncbi:MAG: hypothetical protein KDA28_10375 [Phycisphaerales bacterium]|nr:hypothetical protein [Phycisphaerales bacterium]